MKKDLPAMPAARRVTSPLIVLKGRGFIMALVPMGAILEGADCADAASDLAADLEDASQDLFSLAQA